LKHCSTCGRDIPETATLCDECARVADLFGPAEPAAESDAPSASADPPGYDPPSYTVIPTPRPYATVVAMPAAAPAPAAAPKAAPQPSPKPASKPASAGLGQREVILIGVVAFIAAVVTFGLLFARGGTSSAAAAPAANARRGAPAPAPVVTESRKWSDENRAFWLANQRHSAAFELQAENMVPTWLGRVRPLLVVRCVSKKVETFVYTRSAMKIEPNAQDKTVTIGFDGEPARTERWPDSQDHDALFAPDGAAFAERLTHARTLQFGYTPHNVDPVVAEFHVAGLADMLQPVAADCGRAAPEQSQDARRRRPTRK
jgi:hypothetical protein